MSELIRLADELEGLTGEREFLYSTRPTLRGTTRYVFKTRNFIHRESAIEYLRFRIEQAKAQASLRRAD